MMLDLTSSPGAPRFALSKYDEIIIGDVPYCAPAPSHHGYVLNRVDGSGMAVELRHDEIGRRVTAGSITVNRNRFLPEEARRRLEAPSCLFSSLPDKAQESARYRHAHVIAAEDMRREGILCMTDEAIELALPELAKRAKVIFLNELEAKRAYAGSRNTVQMGVSSRSLRTWIKNYERNGVNGLVDGRSRSGRRADVLSPEVRLLLMHQVRRYACPNEPSKEQILLDVKRAFKAANNERAAAGVAPLETPTRHAVNAAIASLDPFHVHIARYGLQKAREKFAPVGDGLNLTRPLERVEIDEWNVDLIALLADSGLLSTLTDEDRMRMGLDDRKMRFWLVVAICATTRVIVGMKLTKNPTASAAMQTLEMTFQDKHVFTDAVGALSPWNMYGTPELIVTDCGSAFKSLEFKSATQDLGIRTELAAAGEPCMRGTIERLFRTMGDKLMARLTGRTFGSLAARGDHDPGASAALSADDLCYALVRWVVDVYHNSPHEGLDGETPFNAWLRLTEKFGVAPPPSLRSRRLVFGTKLSRMADREGVVVLGVRYHCVPLARWVIANGGAEVDVRWSADDIGAVMVRLGADWIEVPSVCRRFAGVSAQTWLMAGRQLRASRAAATAMSEDIVFRAIGDIEEMNGAAMRRIGLLAPEWTTEEIAREQDMLFVGFEILSGDAPTTTSTTAPRGLGRSLSTASAVNGQLPVAPFAPTISAPLKATASSPCSHVPAPGLNQAQGAGDEFGFEEK